MIFWPDKFSKLMSKNQQSNTPRAKVVKDRIVYSINEEEKTSTIISYKPKREIIIPNTINYETKEYTVTNISKHAFCGSSIKSIRFLPGSKLRTIERYSFFNSNIEALIIPSQFIELEEGWCINTKKLSKIKMNSSNPKYICIKNKAIFCKTNPDQANYNRLIFCARENVKFIKIPNFIEHIDSYAFQYCRQLVEIEFQNNSKLQTIGDHAFESAGIKRITIPSQVIEIGPRSFFSCNVQQIKFEKDSKLQIINENAFDESLIENITIPSQVTEIKKNVFAFCNKLRVVEFEKDSKIQSINEMAFEFSSIENITIPSQLIDLKDGWCFETPNLIKINISASNPRYCCYFNDKMIIGKTKLEQENYDCLVFCCRNIEDHTIPNFIKHISPYSYNYCNKIQKIIIPNDSNLQEISDKAFFVSSIKEITIPSQIQRIGKSAFYNCEQFQRIEIPFDSKLHTIDDNAFIYSSIESIKIPAKVARIGEGAFCKCKQLKKVEFECNSKLQSIEKEAFCETPIESIKIPSNLKSIGEKTFFYCQKLRKIEIENNSELQTINDDAFYNTSIESFSIPSYVKKIGYDIFYGCKQLKIVEIGDKSEIKIINLNMFDTSNRVLLMIPANLIIHFINEHRPMMSEY